VSSLGALLDGLAFERLDALPVELSAVDIARVTIDSRKVEPGVLFVACAGATASSRDGHEFLERAAAAGAAALVVGDRERGRALAGRLPVILADEPRRLAAILAERALREPSRQLKVVGITGTNGKTTATWLLAQLAAAAGKKAAVLGTLGAGAVERPRSLGFTTPEAEVLSAELRRLADEGFEVVAMEVSSHALAMARVDGISFAVTAFTNLSRDHLDFHGTMEAYLLAKARLFTELAPAAPAALPAADDEEGYNARLRALHPALTHSWGRGGHLDARGVSFLPTGIAGELVERGCHALPFSSPLLGAYNLENILVAAACARALGLSLEEVAAGLAGARSPPGRLERVDAPAEAPAHPLVVVDYAHTPDALERALHVMRGVCAEKLIVVFGCGGERDPGKRPIMGRIAADIADIVVVTDDNPRGEDGARIVEAIEQGIGERKRKAAPRALEPGTWTTERARRMAIRAAIAAATDDDVVLVAGKGHERTQTIGGAVLPFDDVAEARRALAGAGSPALLSAELIVDALPGAELHGALPPVLVGVSTDSRRVEPGSLFVALRGESFDGHAFLKSAFVDGLAGAAIVEKAQRATVPDQWPLLFVDDTLGALQALARRHLAALPGRRVALTGSNGKTTTKELIAACLRAALGGPWVLATRGNLNNHIGVPLTALEAEPEHAALVFEMGMNHLGEIALLADIVRPEVGLVTNIGTAHAGNVGGVEGVARAKAELFEALPSDGVAVVNADDPRCVREAQAKARCRHVSFGRAPWADVKLVSVRDRETGGQELDLAYGGESVETSIALDGRHNAVNAAGAVAVAVALGLPFAPSARGLAEARLAHGRLERVTLAGGVWLLDDSYNANPDSMEAAFDSLKELAGARRKLVALGEMRELGDYAEQAHRHIGAAVAQAGAAALFACGELGRLYGEGAVRAGLPPSAFVWAADSAALAPLVVSAVADGDVVLVKGSRGARTELVVDALKRSRGRHAAPGAPGAKA
jgi:MurE/MurF fusion protein